MTNAPKLPLWVIALGTGSAVMGITLITPALPAIASALNVLPEKVQQLLTFYLAMLALGQLAIGPLSDVFGRRIFFITGAFLIGASGLVTSFISQIANFSARHSGAGGCGLHFDGAHNRK